VIGVASAYFAGKVDLLVQRVMTSSWRSADHPGARGRLDPRHRIGNVIVAIAIPMIPRAALVTRSSALAIREMPYVDAARAAGFRIGASSCGTCSRT